MPQEPMPQAAMPGAMPQEGEQGKQEQQPMTVRDLAEFAKMYHVPVSRGTLESMADDSGEIDPKKAELFQQHIIMQAQGLYPGFAPQIAGGIPTDHLVEPYRQVSKMVLGDHVEPDFVGDPKWGAALTGGSDPKTGRPVPMGLDQWKNHLMTDRRYGFEFTPQAHEQVNHMRDTIRQAMEEG
jgi:hypothetical protein